MGTFSIAPAREYIKSLQGYRLSDIHFRIGRKYHTNTFVHAKVLLHNSFYTSRIALRIAIDLSSVLSTKKAVTLVGYERYSELLLGMVTHFLHSMYSGLTVSSCIMVDDDDRLSIYGSRDNYRDYVVIVPIVSTATTTQRMISTYKKETSFDCEPLHVFHILHLRPNENAIKDTATWKTFLSASLEWYKPYECKKCFDEAHNQSLLEADQSNLNPIVIFGKPSVKKVHPIGIKNVIADEQSFVGCPFSEAHFDHSLIYLQDNNNQGLRTYSHKTGVFIQENRSKIEEWLGKVKNDFQIKPTDRVVILSPCQNNETNMAFVNLVNEKVFGSAATIIYHEADREYPENFRLLNYDFLKKETLETKADQIKVFYVDDDLVSGRSFFTIYDLFRYSTDYSQNFTMTGAIFLMNKASANLNQRVTRASKRVHSFIAINLPQYYSVRQRGPFEREISRYEAIEKHSVSYSQERYFRGKRERIASGACQETESNEEKELHLQMFLATNVLFEIFAKEDFSSLSFEQLFQRCRELDYHIKNRFAVIRVLSRATFTMFMPLKEMIFKWIKEMLPSYEGMLEKWMNYVEPEKKDEKGKKGNKGKRVKKGALMGDGGLFKVEEDLEVRTDRHLEMTDLNNFEVLIRRAALMGNYRIIQEDFLKFLDRVFVESEKIASIDVGHFENRVRHHYCELIHKNIACVPLLFSHLNNVSFSSSTGKLFKSCVLDEAIVTVDYLYGEMVSSGFHDRVLELAGEKAATPAQVTQVVSEWRKKRELENSLFIANSVMKVNLGGKKEFESFCYLKHLFYSDKIRTGTQYENVKATLDDIFTTCKGLFGRSDGIGAFFAVFDIAGDLRLVYDRNENGAAILRNKFRQDDFQSYLKDLDPGVEKPVVKSIDATGSKSDLDFLSKFGEQYKFLVLLHVGSVEKDKTDGIIGFYSKKAFSDRIGRGYLMLLRKDFLNFISIHHKNDEFVALLLAENKRRFEYLSGHGRETIQKLAFTYQKEFERVISTMERVQGIFLVDDSTNVVNVELFDRYFKPSPLSNELNDSFKSSLKDMAMKIYSGENIVEWNEDNPEIEVNLENVNLFKGEFSIRLLEFICFELMLNAKKNRFFKTDAFNEIYKETSFRCNRFRLDFIPWDDRFEIKASGTGFRLWKTTKTTIDDNADIKKNNDISGLDLIVHLITTFDNGNKLEIVSVKEDGPVYENSVSVFIKYRPKLDINENLDH